MIKIGNYEVMGWGHAIRGARNPFDSWNKSDSFIHKDGLVLIGDADYKLLSKLAKAGPDHGKFMRMITVYVDITAPLYWWKEFDTYKVGTVANSCSTMHKIHSKEFTLDDFSCEHICNFGGRVSEDYEFTNKDAPYAYRRLFKCVIDALNGARDYYNDAISKGRNEEAKRYWWQMIQLLPSSYNQKRTVMLNYAVLKNMYHARKNHKLDEWHTLCEWIETLPYSELITEK